RQNTPQATIWRWRAAFQNDFAARIRWTQMPPAQANHAPLAVLNGMKGLQPIEVKACPGAPVMLSAGGSVDPDGGRLSYHWWWYRESGGLFSPDLTLSSDGGQTITAVVGGSAHTDQFAPPTAYKMHVILEVTDAGMPTLTSYRRAIITVPGASAPGASAECSVKAIPPSH
ncbi:MAG: hypothetical protein ABW169_11490, partial [Sphingobium sp.]